MNTITPGRAARRGALLAALAALLVGGCSPTEATTSASVEPAWAPLNHLTVPAPSLEGNLLGEPAERDVWVYLPPAYFENVAPLPVIYYLPGYGDATMLGVTLPRDFDAAFEEFPPAIVVIASGVNTFSGSYYVDSTTTGNWSAFVSEDLVSYVDSTFRTIPDRASRGIAGHSMGGFGALDNAMRHADVFGSVFAMAPGLFDPEGEQRGPLFASEERIRSMVDLVEETRTMTPEEAILALRATALDFDIAYGMAFAPRAEPPFFDYPYSLDGDVLVRDDAVWSRWASGFGGIDAETAEFADAWLSLDGIGVDVPTADENRWIPPGCAYFDVALTDAGIPHEYVEFAGNHGGLLRTRILEHMLPFFAEHLAVSGSAS